MTQLPDQDRTINDRNLDSLGLKHRKKRMGAGTLLLIVAAPIAFLVIAIFGLSGIVGAMFGPVVSSTPKIVRPTTIAETRDPLAQNRIKLQKEISTFRNAERIRAETFTKRQTNINKTMVSALGELRKESGQVASRVVSGRFGANLSWAEIVRRWPERFGGNSSAVDQLFNEAVGSRSSAILDRANEKFAGELSRAGAKAEPTLKKRTLQEIKRSQLHMTRQIIRLAPEQLEKVAKKYGVRVAGRTVAKSPVIAVDGPIPAADAVLFITMVADIYNQGGAARVDLKNAMRTLVFDENRAVLVKSAATSLRSISKINQTTRFNNCVALKYAYKSHPVGDLKPMIEQLCRG